MSKPRVNFAINSRLGSEGSRSAVREQMQGKGCKRTPVESAGPFHSGGIYPEPPRCTPCLSYTASMPLHPIEASYWSVPDHRPAAPWMDFRGVSSLWTCLAMPSQIADPEYFAPLVWVLYCCAFVGDITALPALLPPWAPSLPSFTDQKDVSVPWCCLLYYSLMM